MIPTPDKPVRRLIGVAIAIGIDPFSPLHVIHQTQAQEEPDRNELGESTEKQVNYDVGIEFIDILAKDSEELKKFIFQYIRTNRARSSG